MYTARDHTFVICAYRDNPYLGETIQTLQNQTTPSAVMVSTSTPSEYIRTTCKVHQVPLVINEHPHYAGDDWNYGYDQAQTRLVTIAHQDDDYDQRYVETLISRMNDYPEGEVLMCFTDYRELRKSGPVVNNTLLRIKRIMNASFSHKSLNDKKVVKKLVLGFGCPICCPSVLLNKEMLGPAVFDTRFRDSCDYMTWVNLANRPGRFLYVDEILLGHRIYEESATSRNLAENIRTGETLEILSQIWPRPIAKLVNIVYSKSEGLNAV